MSRRMAPLRRALSAPVGAEGDVLVRRKGKMQGREPPPPPLHASRAPLKGRAEPYRSSGRRATNGNPGESLGRRQTLAQL